MLTPPNRSVSTLRIVATVATLVVAVPVHAAPVTESPSDVRVAYDHGLLVSTIDERFSMRLSAWGALRFTFDSIEATDLSRSNRYAFSVPRGRISLDGALLGPTLRYEISLGFDDGTPQLQDFNIQWRALPGDLHLTVGQFKRPWSREHLTRGDRVPMSRPSRTGEAFYAGRDLGLMLHNGLMESPPFEWAVALMNGTDVTPRLIGATASTEDGEVSGGRFITTPSSFKPAMYLRLGYNHNRASGYSYTDLMKGPFRWSIALSAMVMLDTEDTTQSLIGAQADLLVQFRGLSVSGAGFVTSHQTGSAFGDRDWERAGFDVHAGYLMGPSAWTVRPELVARYAQVAERGGVDEKVGRFGVNVFFSNARLRWTTDAALIYRFPRLDSDGPDTIDYQLVTQLAFTL